MFKFAGLAAIAGFAVTALASPSLLHSDMSSLTRRSLAGQNIAFSCYGGGGDCECPTDLTGDSNGVLINVYPGYQCAYPGGACTWDDVSVLQPINRFSHANIVCTERFTHQHPPGQLPLFRSLRQVEQVNG